MRPQLAKEPVAARHSARITDIGGVTSGLEIHLMLAP